MIKLKSTLHLATADYPCNFVTAYNMESVTNIKAFLEELTDSQAGSVRTDDLSLALYSTDASLYEVRPLAVAIPRHEEELISIVASAHKHGIPILPRGSATSLAGQTVNRALVIDFTRHFDKILSIDPEQKTATVQPGVVRDQLNNAVKDLGLHFAPDPATTSRATIGGMIANNSSGTKSIKYGKTIDHIIGMKVLLMDGTILDMKQLSPQAWEQKASLPDREGEIYRRFRQIIFNHSDAISNAYPKVMRRVQGYPLDEFIHTDQWNLAKIFSGSEGSLGIILEATVNLEPIPKYKAAFTLHYHDRLEAIREVREMLHFDPAAIEMLDFNVFEQSKKNNLTRALHGRLITGEPQATLSVEFFCLSANELEDTITSFLAWLQNHSKAYAWPILRTPQQLEDSWSLRKNGLGLLMGDPEGRKPIPFIEDMAIPVDHLADYISEVLDLCRKHGVETILYAHASVGVLHVRPALDMTSSKDIELMKTISSEVFNLVKKYKGSWSGEHGDGRNRGHRLRDFFGDEVYGCLEQVKDLFDPEHLLNPGIIIDVPPMDSHLRYGADYTDKPYDFVYHYRKDHSFGALVHMCSGVGACRNKTGGTMCPSFRATGDEDDSTRGRANALRLAMAGKMGFKDLIDPKVLETLDLCLSCKACKSECPSNVDMAKLKSEVLQKKYDTGSISLREKAIGHSHKMSSVLSGWKAPLVNYIQGTTFFRLIAEWMLKVDRRRRLPSYAPATLTDWYRKNYKTKNLPKTVALFADTYLNYHEPHTGIAAIQLLNDCGYEVELADVGCCQRPRISNGFLKDAKKDGTAMAEKLRNYLDRNMTIVVCEPSCTSALTDDLPDLIDDSSLASKMSENIMAIDTFLARELEKGHLKGRFKARTSSILIHGHCHQKATFGTQGMKSVYDSIETLSYHEPDSGCCGMAGSFGYDKEHYDISAKIAGNILIPAIKTTDSESLVVANGFSCRHQVSDFARRKPVHWVESITFEPASDQA